MVSRILFFMIVFFLLSCNSTELMRLGDSSIYKVPKDINFFKKYEEKLNVQLPNDIDLASIYEHAYDLDYKNRKLYDARTGNKSAFKFYKKGRVNLFYYEEKEKNIFHPKNYGYRGICYEYKNDFKLLMIVPVTEYQKYGVQNYNLKIKGDTLLISVTNKHFTKEQIFTGVYVKKELGDNTKQVNW